MDTHIINPDAYYDDPGKPGNKKIIPTQSTIPARDNVSVVNRLVPVNNSPGAIQASKQAVALNQQAVSEYNYYHPEVKNIQTGDKAIDFLYKNQWMMDAPIVGGFIKNKAYEVAKNSNSEALLDPKNLAQTGNYRGATTENDKTKLLDVYFGKQKLPQSIYKPKDDYMPFLPSYSVKNDQNIKRLQENGKMQSIVNNILAFQKSDDAVNIGTPEYNKKPIYVKHGRDSDLSDILGVNLGGHKTGMGYDEEKQLPYVSISDAWDFEPNAYSKKWKNMEGKGSEQNENLSYIESSLMHKAGQPFKIYDRFYFDPKTKRYIPDDKLPSVKAKKTENDPGMFDKMMNLLKGQ